MMLSQPVVACAVHFAMASNLRDLVYHAQESPCALPHHLRDGEGAVLQPMERVLLAGRDPRWSRNEGREERGIDPHWGASCGVLCLQIDT